MLWQILVLSLILWSVYLRYKNRRFINISKQVRTDLKAYPFIGHSYMFIGNGEVSMTAFQRIGLDSLKHGGISSLWLGGKYYVVLSDPELLELLTKKCLEKDSMMIAIRKLVGNGTLVAPVPIWRKRRRILAPTFTLKNLYHFLKIFYSQSRVMVDKLQKETGKGAFPIWKYLTSYTMDSVCASTLGVEVECQKHSDHPFLKAFDQCSQLMASRMMQPWLHSDTIYNMLPYYTKFLQCKNFLYGFIDQVITSKRDVMRKDENSSISYRDDVKTILHLMMEQSDVPGGHSNIVLLEEALVVVLAGTDTSAVGSSFTALMLSRYPEVQDKVYQELIDVFGDSDRPIEPDDLRRLNYLDAVIKETLRLYPPVPAIARTVDKDVMLPSGLTLVEGCGIAISIWATHRNPKYWGVDVDVFRPERFFDSPPKHPAAFIPFSYGPRSCIGYQFAMMSMKNAITSLVLRYRLLPAEDTSGSSHHPEPAKKPIRVTFDIMMKDVDKFTLRLERRK